MGANSPSSSPHTQLSAGAEAFGLHLSRFPWAWYVTLTFRNQVGELSATQALFGFIREIRSRQGFAPGFFAVTEWQRRRRVVHYHLLVLNCEGLRRLSLKDYWERYGFARVDAFDPMRGANYYVGKYLGKDCGRIHLSRNLSRFYADPDSPAVGHIGKVFGIAGQSEQPTSSPLKLTLSPVPTSARAPGK